MHAKWINGVLTLTLKAKETAQLLSEFEEAAHEASDVDPETSITIELPEVHLAGE